MQKSKQFTIKKGPQLQELVLSFTAACDRNAHVIALPGGSQLIVTGLDYVDEGGEIVSIKGRMLPGGAKLDPSFSDRPILGYTHKLTGRYNTKTGSGTFHYAPLKAK